MTTATASPFEGVRPSDYLTGKFLAWDSIDGERNRNRVGGFIALFLTVVLVFVFTHIQVPKVDRATAEKVPERLAKMVMKQKEEPPPPPPPKPEEQKKPEEEKPVAEEKPQEKPTDVQVQKARQQAEKAMSEAKKELAAMQDLASAFDMGGNQTLTKAGGNSAGVGSVSRDMITSRAGKGSGGVTMGAASSGGGGYGVAGGAKLAGGEMAKVESNITEAPTGPTRKTAGGKLVRTEEEVRRVMERSNGALQAIYQRALRNNPALKGAVVLHLVIAPDGTVSTCDLVSSELGDPDTEKKLIARIKAITFGAIEGVAVWDDKYTLNFFPS